MTETSNIEIQEPEPSSARLIFTLGIAGLFSGLLLVGAYLGTLPIIEANKAESLRKAIYEVLPGCQSFRTLELIDGKLVEVDSEAEKAGQGPQVKPAPRIFAGYDGSRELIGFALQASEPGYQDLIEGIIGFDPVGRKVIGFKVLETKETPGLGDKIKKDARFLANFEALAVDPEIVAVKKGEKSKPNEVEAITGATISSKAVVRVLQNGMRDWLPAIEAYMQESEK